MPVRLVCKRCGRSNRPDAEFCDGCGSRLAATPDAGNTLEQRAERLSARGPVGPTAFVGRQEERAALRASLHEALAGNGQLCMLAGLSGIGKTRTALELAGEAKQLGFQVLWGRCFEEPGAPPYWPWIQALRGYLQSCDEDTLRGVLARDAAHVSTIVPEVAERFPDLRSVHQLGEAEQARFALFDSMTLLWKRAARSQPILMALDNLHWADPTSLRLLAFLAPEIVDRRLLVLGTYRDDEVPRQHPLSETLAELMRLPHFHRHRLSGLSRDETECFVAIAAGAAPSPSTTSALYEKTEGNPLYLTEMVRWLLHEDRLRASSGTEQGAASARIPAGIRDVMGKRLNRLSPSCNTLLRIAAVMGRTFRLDLLARLVPEISEDAALCALEEAQSAHVIEASSNPSQYQFSHAMIRETLYEELLPARRARLHQRIGEALEEQGAGRQESHLPQLAYHFSQAPPDGCLDKAIDYAMRAARRAGELLAYEEAARLYLVALQALDARKGPPSAQEVELMLGLGEAQAKAGETLQAMETFRRTAETARQRSLAEHLARAALGFEEASWRPGLPGDAAVRLLRAALDELGESSEIIKVKLLGGLARALILTGAVEESDRVHAQALAIARRIGDPATLMATLCVALPARWRPERIAERIAAASEALALAEQIGDRERFIHILGWRLFDAMELGDMPTIRADLETHAHIAEELRQPFYQYVNVSFRAMLALFEGRLAEGEQLAQRALTLGQRMPGLDAGGMFGMQMFSLRREQGRLKELEPVVRHFVRTAASAAVWSPGLALMYSELDLKREARAELETLAGGDFAGIARDGLWATCIAYLAEVCAYLEDRDRASTLYRLLLPHDEHNIMAGTTVACYGAAARYLGLLATVMERWKEAEDHFESALAMNARAGARPWLAHAQHDYAVMLGKRGQGDDRERAATLLEQASVVSAELEMRALSERIATARRRLGIPVGKARYPDGLTRREVEVLQLIAAGKPNSEIGALLFISPNTVANHIRSILAKTKTANRTEAAAYAVRHGLLTS